MRAGRFREPDDTRAEARGQRLSPASPHRVGRRRPPQWFLFCSGSSACRGWSSSCCSCSGSSTC